VRYFELVIPHLDVPRTWKGSCRFERRWFLPGTQCPKCRSTQGGILSYPAVDLSSLPEREEFRSAWPKPYAEYVRLAELVRPLCPKRALLEPGTSFGALQGTARGRFGPLSLADPWVLLVREDALRAFQDAGLRGIVPVCPELKTPPSPAIFELQLLPKGRLHPDCFPPDRAPPCSLCGVQEWWMPKESWLDAASLPDDLDVFRLEDAVTRFIASERFVEVAQSCGPSDVVFKEVATEPPGRRTLP
jgi:uncharacterized double-CXXCG motif protein